MMRLDASFTAPLQSTQDPAAWARRVGDALDDELRRAADPLVELPGLALGVIHDVGLPLWRHPTSAANVLSTRSAPRSQLDPRGDFSDLPLTLFLSERVAISIHTWVDSTTLIHSHGFSGLFAVLDGHSLHTTFTQEASEVDEPEICIAPLARLGTERLPPGAIRLIAAGRRFVHSLFHVPSPSISLVIRTPVATELQYTFLPPGIAWSAPTDPLFRRKQELVTTTSKVARTELVQVLRDLTVDTSPAETFLLTLEASRHNAMDGAALRLVLRESGAFDDEEVDQVCQALAGEQNAAFLSQRRRFARDVRIRALLGLLSVSAGREFLQGVEAYFGEDPLAVMAELLPLLVRPIEDVLPRGLLSVRLSEDQQHDLLSALESIWVSDGVFDDGQLDLPRSAALEAMLGRPPKLSLAD
jgi:hypothetical protein